MQNIDTLVTTLHSNCNQEVKIKAVCDFYVHDGNLSKVSLHWNKKQYKKAFSYILSFLRKNKKGLFLIYHPIKTSREFASLVGKDSANSNFATIKTIGQFLDLQKDELGRVVSRLIVYYKKNKMSILCLNNSVDDQKKCRALMHEINAWLLAGCMQSARVRGLFGEWRTHIISTGLLKKMDKIFFKL